MSDYKAGAAEKLAASMTVGEKPQSAAQAEAPFFVVDAECVGPEGTRWKDGYKNVVVDEGRRHIVNELFGSKADMRYVIVVPHSITTNGTASTHAWNDVSASRVYAANTQFKSLVGFTSNATALSQSASNFYTWNANATINGAIVGFYSASTMNTSVSSTGFIEYSEGIFVGGSRTVQSNDTLNITVTVSYGTV